MGWEVKTLQKTKETLKHDVDKFEKEILTLESQKKSVSERDALDLSSEGHAVLFLFASKRSKMPMR